MTPLIWFVLFVLDRGDGIPRVAGPYPTEGACRIAARHLDGADERFWSAEERVAARIQRERDQRRSDEAERSRLFQQYTAPGWVPDGSTLKMLTDLQLLGWRTEPDTSPRHVLLSDCLQGPMWKDQP